MARVRGGRPVAHWQNRGVSTAARRPDMARSVDEDQRSSGSRLARWCRRLIAGLLLAAVLVVGGTAVRVWQVARIDDWTTADAIVVLGAAQYSGTPSPVFAARLEQARMLYENGVSDTIVTVGGKQEGDLFTEAASGKNYLIETGVPADAIVAVEEGSDTLLSIKAVSEEMSEMGLSSAVLVSDPWHGLRTRTMARDAGLDAWTAPTRQGPAVFTRESQFHGIARETGALIWYQLTHYSADFEYTADQ
ncbi:uncharacterized SAM-binding protein YcdF (DUF218 family) [Rhodococcus sp. SMB37]|nr:uncharacterized SAM-binding protein YcdF (DUF218 family) [Rhodococcus sp. SMB37]